MPPKLWSEVFVDELGQVVESLRYYDRLGRPIMNTGCKHGVGECALCGMTGERDQLHTTKGGQGVVAQLRQRGGETARKRRSR